MSYATHKIDGLVIQQGATFSERFERLFYPYETTIGPDGYTVIKADGTPAPDEDRVLEDYSGCTARMQIRATKDAATIIADLSTLSGGIVLAANVVTITIDAAATAAMTGWDTAVGDLEIVRADGTVERQYEFTFSLSTEVTR